MKNIKYIGIRGYRGSGKNTIAYLLGCTIQYIIDIHKNKSITTDQLLSDSSFNIAYSVWCDCIKTDEVDALNNMDTENVYLESFGSTPKMLVELLTNIPHEYFSSDYHKDHVVVNLKDFSWRIDDNEANLKSLCSAQAVMNGVEFEGFENSTIYLSLREFIVYFAHVCMKYLGNDVWVKSIKRNEHKYDEFDSYYNIGVRYKIFTDIKAPSEISYIKEHNGIIIKIERPEFRKVEKGVELLDNDDRWDRIVCIEKDITEDENLKRCLVEIAIKLIGNK